MMRKVLMAAALAAIATPASAGVVYTNNFDAENGGASALNYNGFNGLTVTNGMVDLVASGDFGITCAGGTGSCVDLDGSTSDSGLTSSNSFSFAAGDKVSLSLLFSGNQRGGASDSFTLGFQFAGPTSGTHGFESTALGNYVWGGFSGSSVQMSISGITSGYPFSDFSYYFIAANAGSVNFYLQDGGNDNVGVIVDNVSLSVGAVPEPSAWALMILGFGAVGAAARRRRAAGKSALA